MKNKLTIEYNHESNFDHYVPSENHFLDCINKTSTFLSKSLDAYFITVSFVKMASLNSYHRKKQGATNVLSFPESSDCVTGTVYFCPKVIEDENSNSPSYWSLMIVHSLLHLAGYTHDNDIDAEVMESSETKIIANLLPEYKDD